MITPTDMRKAKILIVDDQEINILLLVRMLEGAHYQSIASTMDPRQVCALHEANRYDLILLDLQMPEMNGFQVLDALKRVAGDDYLPVLVITAQPGHKLQALQAGAKDFISKPFELPEVLARVQNLLEVRLLHQALRSSHDILEQRVRERTSELRNSYLQTIYTLTRAAEFRDEDTGVHVQRISYYCHSLAQRLGMDHVFTENLFFASPLHDVKKSEFPITSCSSPGL